MTSIIRFMEDTLHTYYAADVAIATTSIVQESEKLSEG